MRVKETAAAVAVAALVFAACGGDDGGSSTSSTSSGGAATSESTGGGGGDLVAQGGELFQGTCAACHGADAKGLPNLGKDLTTSEFVATTSDDDLVAFIEVGRATSDPANTTGVAMPPKGGNPALSDQDLAAIVAYLRTVEE